MMRSRQSIQDNDQFCLLNTLVAYMVTKSPLLGRILPRLCLDLPYLSQSISTDRYPIIKKAITRACNGHIESLVCLVERSRAKTYM